MLAIYGADWCSMAGLRDSCPNLTRGYILSPREVLAYARNFKMMSANSSGYISELAEALHEHLLPDGN